MTSLVAVVTQAVNLLHIQVPSARLPTVRAGLSAVMLASAMAISGCGAGGGANGPTIAPAAGSTGGASATPTSMSPAALLGEKIFADASLSASGRLSCASCHDPAHAHAQANSLATQLGGADGTVAGTRAAPSLRYLAQSPTFSLGNGNSPVGGFDRDGRAATLAEQARRPLLAAHEMANGTAAAVVQGLQRATYVEQFRQTFGADIFTDPERALDRITFALQQYQKEDPAFAPFDAKYDEFLAGRARLSDSEQRGLALFNDRSKGNCAACHLSQRGKNGAAPLFTDFSFDNLGVPRNPAIGANADQGYFDLGLCGPDRTDLAASTALCGEFKVPSLRNVATRRVFFHNGRFDNLRDVIAFYVRRDTNPEQWYGRNKNGSINKFDDLPEQYKRNVNVTEGPYNRQPGMAPALNAQEIDDVIAFLGTLTDGYRSNP